MATVEYVIPDGLYTRLKIDNHIASGVSKILLTHNVNSSRYLTVQFSGEEMAERCHLGAIVEFEYHRGIPNATVFKDDKKFIGIIKSIAPTDSSVAFTAFDYTTFLAQSQHVLYKRQDYVGEDLYYAAALAATYKGIDTSTLLQGTGIKITEDMDLFGWKTRKEFIDACFNELRYVVNDTAHPTNTVLQWNYAIREGKTMDFYLPDPQSSGAIPAITVSYDNNNIVAEGLVSKIDTSKIVNSITVASSSDETKYVQLEDNDSIQKYGVLSTFISYASTSTSTLSNVAYEVLNRFSKPSYTYNVSLDNADYLDLGDMIALDVPALEKEVIKPVVGYQLEFAEGIKTRYTIGQRELTISEYIDLLSKPTDR